MAPPRFTRCWMASSRSSALAFTHVALARSGASAACAAGGSGVTAAALVSLSSPRLNRYASARRARLKPVIQLRPVFTAPVTKS